MCSLRLHKWKLSAYTVPMGLYELALDFVATGRFYCLRCGAEKEQRIHIIPAGEG